LLFGARTPLAKLVVSSVGSVLISGLLYLGSGVGLAVLRMIHTATGVRQAQTPLAGKDLPWLAGAILAGGVAGPVLLLLGLLKTPASAASRLLNLEAAKGASLEDPGLFNSSLEGNTRRAIDFHEGDKIDEKALKALIRAAVALNTSSAAQRPGTRA
jgi:hypothetical protein